MPLNRGRPLLEKLVCKRNRAIATVAPVVGETSCCNQFCWKRRIKVLRVQIFKSHEFFLCCRENVRGRDHSSQENRGRPLHITIVYCGSVAGENTEKPKKKRFLFFFFLIHRISTASPNPDHDLKGGSQFWISVAWILERDGSKISDPNSCQVNFDQIGSDYFRCNSSSTNLCNLQQLSSKSLQRHKPRTLLVLLLWRANQIRFRPHQLGPDLFLLKPAVASAIPPRSLFLCQCALRLRLRSGNHKLIFSGFGEQHQRQLGLRQSPPLQQQRLAWAPIIFSGKTKIITCFHFSSWKAGPRQ